MGLAQCYQVMRDLGGTIDVRSELGSGSTFEIKLRRAVPEKEAKS
jgi:signal transduction histidine kinase